MAVDLFEFWRRIAPHDHIHPADADIFRRIGRAGHGFQLDALPSPIMGPLKTASVVLLYLSPGFSEGDAVEGATEAGQRRYSDMRAGSSPLPDPDQHLSAWQWWSQRTKVFGDWRDVRTKIAFLNIGAYKSRTFDDPQTLASLPSSRATLDWAQSVLFPAAEAGDRVVVCLRSNRYWGLADGQRYGASLFSPRVNRSGHMLKSDLREEIVKCVAAALHR